MPFTVQALSGPAETESFQLTSRLIRPLLTSTLPIKPVTGLPPLQFPYLCLRL